MGYLEHVENGYRNCIHRASRKDISDELAKKLIAEAKVFATEFINVSLEKDICVLEKCEEARNFLLFDEVVNYINNEIPVDIDKLTRIVSLDFEFYCFVLSYVNGYISYGDNLPRMAGEKYRTILKALKNASICYLKEDEITN